MFGHKNYKEDHKNHKIVFGIASSLSICFVTFVIFFVVFVGKQASSFAQSIVVPNASAPRPTIIGDAPRKRKAPLKIMIGRSFKDKKLRANKKK